MFTVGKILTTDATPHNPQVKKCLLIPISVVKALDEPQYHFCY